MRRCQRYWVLGWSAYDCHACAQCTWQLHYRTELELARRMPSQQRGRCAAWYQDKRKARTSAGDSTCRLRESGSIFSNCLSVRSNVSWPRSCSW